MKILITGANGQLGYELNRLLSPDNSVFPFDIDLDVTERGGVVDRVSSIKPDIVLHCAAMTDVDGCEIDPEKAEAVNDTGTGNVVLACQQVKAAMVYISTDFVFSGEGARPLTETDPTGPINVYGTTKLAGERHVAEGLDRFYVVRTAWLYGLYGNNFVKTILRLAGEKDELSVVNDQTGSPTYARDLAEKIVELIATNRFGLYHIANSGQSTWYDFALDILETAGITGVSVKPITSEALQRPARRPAYSVLDNKGLSKAGLPPLRNFKEALRAYIGELALEEDLSK